MLEATFKVVGFLLLAGTICVTTVQACSHHPAPPVAKEKK